MIIVSKASIDQLRRTEGHRYNKKTFDAVEALLDVTGEDPFSDFFGYDLLEYATVLFSQYEGNRRVLGKRLFKLFRAVLPEGEELPLGINNPRMYLSLISAIGVIQELIESRYHFAQAQVKTSGFLRTTDSMEKRGIHAPNNIAFTRYMILLVITLHCPEEKLFPLNKLLVIFCKFLVAGCSVLISSTTDQFTEEQREQMSTTEKANLMFNGVERMKQLLFTVDLDLPIKESSNDAKGKNPDFANAQNRTLSSVQ